MGSRRNNSMDEGLFSQIVLNSERRKAEARAFTAKRYLYSKIKAVPKGYFAGMRGLRGIGKTVMLLQLANELPGSLYIPADSSLIKGTGLYEAMHFAISRGYSSLFVDEIHCKKDWQQDLKTIYDEEGNTRVFFSGSAALEIGQGADLSRRALLFDLLPLSFREFLAIKKKVAVPPAVSAKDLFDEDRRRQLITATAQHAVHLRDYFRQGGLLYASEDTEYFHKALENTVEKIIHSDLECLRAIDANAEETIYKLLEWIAFSQPGEVNYSTLASKTSASKPTVIRMIDDLTKTGLLKKILPCGKAVVRKEPKIYLAFPFREYFNAVFARTPDTGALREEFFVNHAQKLCYLKTLRGQRTPDFIYENKTVEVGGGGKNFGQNPDYLIKDAVTLEPKTIPLYLTGYLY